MGLQLLYYYETRVGTFYIGQNREGRFHPLFDGESLGSYHRDFQAAEDSAGGHTFSVSGGHDTAELNIPYDLSE